MKYFLCPSIILLVLITSGCAVNPATGKREIMIFSDSQEVEFGKSADPDVRWQFGGAYEFDEKLLRYVEDVGQKVASVSDRKNIPYHFTIVDSSIVNAFALPGGYIYITRGLLAKLDNEAQLAAVLGHEIGHVTARHSMKRLQSIIGFNVLFSIFDRVASDSESYRKQRALIKTASSVAFAAVSLGYGRENELQADSLGTNYIFRAGYDPNGMVQLLELLKSLNEREPTIVEEFFMSHPRTSVRIENVKALTSKLSVTGEARLGQSEYKSMVRGLFEAQKAYALCDMADAMRRKGNYNGALSEYKKASELLPNIPQPYYGMGLIYLAQGKYESAVAEFKKAISRKSDYVFAYNGMGLSYIAMKQYDDAVSILKKAISIYQNYDDAYANLGEAFYNLKQFRDALKTLEFAVSLNEKHPRAYTTLGLTYEALGDLQKAISAYQMAIKVAPDDSYTNVARERLASLNKNG